MTDLMTLKAASVWASDYLDKEVTTANISYLVQYGRIAKKSGNGGIQVNKYDLKAYYDEYMDTKENRWKEKLGDDLNWNLSFAEYKEAETTKHVHRLHPYKGKFIPQLVEYFLDGHTDRFKQAVFFQPGDIVLDPFCGSGTTLVQACELNLHAVGIDISAFNAFISNAKISTYDLDNLQTYVEEITDQLQGFQQQTNNLAFENHLLEELKAFNHQFFPVPEFKHRVRQRSIDEQQYGQQKSAQFLTIYYQLIEQYKIQVKQAEGDSFLDKWFVQAVRDEIDCLFEQIQPIKNPQTKKILALILSRTIRSCRATTHADLGTLKEPVTTTYYCKKHGKICKPLFSISGWWQRYTQDTIKRLRTFAQYKTATYQYCLSGDSRCLDITRALEKKQLANLVRNNQFAGIFSSPPYVGLIDYHEQHAYAYDLFGFARNDELEIGPLYKGQGMEARKSYIEGVAAVLNHCKSFLKPDYNVFLVANDKYNLYPAIAENANMKIVQRYKRPVLNRVEKNRSAYAEIIFQLQEKWSCH